MISIYDYSDYRQYLKDFYETKKALNPAFSFRYLAQKAGINSAPFFKFIMEGKRNLTKATILKTCVALKFDDRQAEYFENLVFFNQAKTVKEKNHFFEKLIQKQRGRNIGKVTENQYEYFSQWYHCVIRELVCMFDFKDDFVKLATTLSPQITSRQAADSVKLLLSLGLLKKNDGKYFQTDAVISSGYGMTAHQIINFQIAMLERATEAFDKCKSQDRLTSATTFGISKKTFSLFQEKLRTMRSEFLEQARSDESPEMVYELTINLFPLTLSRDAK